uniref:Uncharacterized protein n=1 Tax=Wolbachia endosymbiont of Aleurodicus floccissimus TaxID=2152762 RepID=A0A3B0JKH8_9RICK
MQSVQYLTDHNEIDISVSIAKRSLEESDHAQDFELIRLLIEEAITIQQGNFVSFQARFQSFLDQIPSYLYSAGQSGFFPHFF